MSESITLRRPEDFEQRVQDFLEALRADRFEPDAYQQLQDIVEGNDCQGILERCYPGWKVDDIKALLSRIEDEWKKFQERIAEAKMIEEKRRIIAHLSEIHMTLRTSLDLLDPALTEASNTADYSGFSTDHLAAVQEAREALRKLGWDIAITLGKSNEIDEGTVDKILDSLRN